MVIQLVLRQEKNLAFPSASRLLTVDGAFDRRIDRTLSKTVDQVAERIKSTPLGTDAESAAYVRNIYETMIPLQRQLLWQRLLKCTPLAHDNLLVLNNMLGLSICQNSEIRFL